ncbi:Amino acid transporter transmembrane [Carpediemonas membranifera]|uniref:Amino acid transporter transmembrane n=1 Tax=Carpediemonas membranifera TaxID=201153 RepID=A0A8J6E8S6_9EUKA|nr:Amino acid transporter transmembrane [Carpediemonas membranifera]|eukprot:KAG9392335.1 Amino acid transporter transmembrane [Carpediemonas membranifera]
MNTIDADVEIHSDGEMIVAEESIVQNFDERSMATELTEKSQVDEAVEDPEESFNMLANESIVVVPAEHETEDFTAELISKEPDEVHYEPEIDAETDLPATHSLSFAEPVTEEGSVATGDLIASKLEEHIAASNSANYSKEDLGEAGIFSSIFNIANTILGAGTVTLPYAFKSAGIFMGLVLIIASYLVMLFSMRILVRACHRLAPRVYSYRGLAIKCFGGWAGPVIEIMIACLTTGFLIAYTIIIGDYVSALAEDYLPFASFLHSPFVIRVLMLTFVIFPLCCLKSMRLLSFTSGIAVACVLFTSVFVAFSFLFSLGQGNAAVLKNDVTWFKFDLSAFMAISLYSTAFAAHFTLPSIYQELKKKELSLLSPAETPALESPGAQLGALRFIKPDEPTVVRRVTKEDYPEVTAEEGRSSSDTSEHVSYERNNSIELGSKSPLGRSRANSTSELNPAARSRRQKMRRIIKSGSDKDWRRMWSSLFLGLSICMLVYCVVGICGYLEFGDSGTKDNILMSFDSGNVARDMAIAAMSAVIMFSLPLVHFATRQSTLNAIWCVVRRKPYSFGWPSHIICAICWLAVCLAVATVLPSVSIVFNVMFSVFGTLVYFFMPGLFYIKFRMSFTDKDEGRTTWRSQLKDKTAWAAVVLMLISLPLGVISFISTFI